MIMLITIHQVLGRVDGSIDKQFIWTLLLWKKVELDQVASLYRQLNVAGDPVLVDTDRYKLKK